MTWVRNKKTRLVWEVTPEHARALIEGGEYEEVAAPKTVALETQKPVKGKPRAKPD